MTVAVSQAEHYESDGSPVGRMWVDYW